MCSLNILKMASLITAYVLLFIFMSSVVATVMRDYRKLEGEIPYKNKLSIGEKCNYSDSVSEENLNFYTPVSDAFDNSVCKQHSIYYRDGVRTRELWALKMFHASSKLPWDLSYPTNSHFRQISDCLDLENIASPVGTFWGQYCSISITSHTTRTQIVKQKRQRSWQTPEGSYENNSKKLYSFAIVQKDVEIDYAWSVCVPSSCSAHDVELHTRRAIHDLTRKNFSVTTSNVACLHYEKLPMTPLVPWVISKIKILLVVFALLLVLGILSDKMFPSILETQSEFLQLPAVPPLEGKEKPTCIDISHSQLPEVHKIRADVGQKKDFTAEISVLNAKLLSCQDVVDAKDSKEQAQ